MKRCRQIGIMEETIFEEMEVLSEIPDNSVCVRCSGHGKEKSYNDLKTLSLDAANRIHEMKEREDNHICVPEATYMTRLLALNAELESQIAKLRENEHNLLNRLDLNGKKQYKAESDTLVNLRLDVKKQVSLIAIQQTVIMTLRSKIEYNSRCK